jgi:hypothetical protein
MDADRLIGVTRANENAKGWMGVALICVGVKIIP